MPQHEEYATGKAVSGTGGARGNGSNTPSTGTATGTAASGTGTSAITENVKQSLATAKDRIADTVIAAQDRSTEAMHSAAGYIQRAPFTSIAIAAALGAVIGFLLAERASEMLPRTRSLRSWW